jgi:alkylation response protein AidB-like acyl-CoA dehydrogenase
VPTNVVADAIARDGTDDQRKELLSPIARGECLAAWALSVDASPDPRGVAVHATPERDGYRLDGRAGYVHGAMDADLLLVAAMAAEGVINCLVSLPLAGVSVRALEGLDLTRALGVVDFDGVVVPRSSVLDGGDARATIGRALEVATVLHAAEAVGAADYLFDATVQYLRDRVQFGRPIASFQAIKHRLADMKIRLEGMRAAAHLAALALGDGFDDKAEAVSTAGAFVPDVFAALCGEALQLHGGIGFTWEHDVHLFVRRAKVNQVLYGDPAWHRERLCALAEAATPMGAE